MAALRAAIFLRSSSLPLIIYPLLTRARFYDTIVEIKFEENKKREKNIFEGSCRTFGCHIFRAFLGFLLKWARRDEE